jgi:hypothetical protein
MKRRGTDFRERSEVELGSCDGFGEDEEAESGRIGEDEGRGSSVRAGVVLVSCNG